MSSYDDPWLDLSVIALAVWAVLVRAVRCTGILPAQQVMGPDNAGLRRSGTSSVLGYQTVFGP